MMPAWMWAVVLGVCVVVGLAVHPLVGLAMLPLALGRILGTRRKKVLTYDSKR